MTLCYLIKKGSILYMCLSYSINDEDVHNPKYPIVCCIVCTLLYDCWPGTSTQAHSCNALAYKLYH